MQWTGLILAAMTMLEPTAGAGGRWRGPAEYAGPPDPAAAGQTAAPAVAAQTCAAFADPDYGGAVLRIRDSQPLEWVGRSWDNRISSTVCAAGCRLVGYQHVNYGGPRANFSGAVARLGPVFDDRISAARVVCAAEHGH